MNWESAISDMLRKDRWFSFFSRLDMMNPEVAISLISKIPQFFDFLSTLAGEYRLAIEKMMAQDEKGQESLISSAKQILSTIEWLLKNREHTPEEELKLVKLMVEVQKMLNEKDTETKSLRKQMINFLSGHSKTIIFTGMLIAGGFGVIRITKKP